MKNSIILCIALLISVGIYTESANGFVIGVNTYTSTFLSEIRAENQVTNVILKPIRSASNAAPLDIPSNWCDSRLNSLAVFDNQLPQPLVVFCDNNGEPLVLGVQPRTETYTLVELDDRNLYTGSEFSGFCSSFYSEDYEEATSMDLLLTVPHGRAYPAAGTHDAFFSSDLLTYSSRGYANDILVNARLYYFSIPATSLETSSTLIYNPPSDGPTLVKPKYACRHKDAPIKFVYVDQPFSVDALNDYASYYQVIDAGLSPLDVIHSTLLPATTTIAIKDQICAAYAGPAYRAASTSQVQNFLRSHVNPRSSFVTFTHSPSDCAISSEDNELNYDSIPFPVVDPSGFDPAWQAVVRDNEPAEYGLKCMPSAFVVSDSCEPLMATSHAPSSTFDAPDGFALPTGEDYYGLPVIRRAQEALDYCLEQTTSCNRNCTCPNGVGAQYDSLVASSGISTSANIVANPGRRALHGYLACTNIPQGNFPRPVATQCAGSDSIVGGLNNTSDGVPIVTLSYADNQLSTTFPNYVPGNATYLNTQSSSLVTLFNARAFRIEGRLAYPNEAGVDITFTFSSPANLRVFVSGCGYDDDTFAAVDFTTVTDVVSGVPLFVPFKAYDCAIFVLVGSTTFSTDFPLTVSYVPTTIA